MTEDEAKTKWCPFVRRLAVFSTDGTRQAVAAYNRAATDYTLPEAKCIGSACMAWRWGADAAVDPSPEPFAMVARGSPEALRRKEALAERLAAVRPGFCGLAGAPQ